MNSNGLAPPHIPQALLHTLLQAPALLAALRSMIAGAGAPKSASETPLLLPAPCARPSLLLSVQLITHTFIDSKYFQRLQQMSAHASCCHA